MKKLLTFSLLSSLFSLPFSNHWGGNCFSQCLMRPVSLQDRIQQSPVIIEGKVISKNSFWDAPHHLIYTSNLVEIYKVFRGSVATAQVEIITEGGMVGNEMHRSNPSLHLSENDMGIFLCSPTQVQLPNFPSLPVYDAVASAQGFIRYDASTQSATDIFYHYTNIASDVYSFIQQQTQQNYSVKKSFVFPKIQNQNGKSLAVSITSFSPTTVSSGTKTLLTVNGSGFGATQGNSYVSFKNADDGGASYIQPLSSEYVSWSDVKIEVYVTSNSTSGETAGTGTIRVTNGSSTATSSNSLTISFAELNVDNSGSNYQTDLVNDDGAGGYTWRMYTGFDANTNAKNAFLRSFQSWRCGTFVNWQLGATTTVNTIAADGTAVIRFDVGSELSSGVLGRSSSYWTSCGSGVWYVSELDIVFDDGTNWNYSTNNPSFSQYDFESVTLHELGHGHQLGHVIDATNVMHYNIGNGQTSRVLQTNDLTAGNDVMSRSSITNNSCGPTKMNALTTGNCQIGCSVAITISSPNPSCTGNNGSATANATGGTSPYTYLWSNGNSTQTISGLSAGTYTVTATTSDGCNNTQSVALTTPGTPTATTSTTNESATGACDGSATATAGGGTSPYTYDWSTAPSQNTATATGLCAGIYSVTVTGQDGCSTTSTATVSSPNPAGCDTLSNYELAVDTPALYLSDQWGYISGHNNWDDRAKADIFTATSGDTVKSAILYFAKAYPGSINSSISVNIWDGTSGTPGNILGSATVPVSQITTTQGILVNFSPSAVVSGNFFCGMEISANGTPQDTVALLTNKNGNTVPGTAWEKWNDSTWHTYKSSWNVDIANAIFVIKCSGSGSPNCTGYTASATSTNPSCGTSNGTATVSAIGGSTPYTYVWNNGQTTASITGLSAGTYSVTVTAGNQCTATALVTLTSSGALTATATSTNPSCGTSNGTATVSASGGVTPYTYAWNNGQTTASITGLSAGTYSVAVTAGNQCTATASVTLTSSGTPTATATSTNSTCGTSNGTATVSASGGITPYTYAWSNGQTMATATGLAPGSYTVTVTGNNQCSVTAFATVANSGTPPSLSTSSTNASCGTNNGTASVTASGGTSSYSYMWSNGQTTTSISGLGAGAYAVTVTSGNCTATASVAVSGGGNFNVAVSAQNTNCMNTCNGQVQLAPSGGTAPYTFLWSNGSASASQTGLCIGGYSVTVTDNTSCSVTKQINISSNSPAMFVSSSATNATCNNANGTATLNSSGGVTPYVYFWSSNPPQSTQTATGLAGGTYDGIVTDINGCSDTVTIFINNVGGVTANITGNPTICQGSSATLVASGGASYSWNTGASTNSISVSPAATTTYYVTVSDNSACSDSASATVTVNSIPVTTVGASDDTVCKNESVMLVASGGTTYVWAGIAGTNDTVYVTPSQTTTYYVTAFNGNCPGNNASVKVNVEQPSPTAVATADTTTVYLAQGGTVNFSSAGSMGTSFGWDFTGNGSIDATTPNATHNYTASGTFNAILSVTFGNCTDYDTIVINVYTQVGIAESQENSGISVYPNPNNGRFTIGLPSSVIGHRSSVIIYNVLGEIVYSTIITSTSTSINLTGGVYFVNVSSMEKTFVRKIMVMGK